MLESVIGIKNYGCWVRIPGNSLAVQWLGLHSLTAKDPGSIPGQGTKIRKLRRVAKKKKNSIIPLAKQVTLYEKSRFPHV